MLIYIISSKSSKIILNNILGQRIFSFLQLLLLFLLHFKKLLLLLAIRWTRLLYTFLKYSPPYYRQFWVICLSASTNGIIKHAVHYSFVSEKSPLRDSPFKTIPPFSLLCGGQGSGRKDRHAVCNVREAHWWEAPPH